MKIRGPKKLDKLIVRNYVLTFFFSILLFSAIGIVFDISEKMDKFVRNDLGFWDVAKGYYIHFVPWLYNILYPIFCFIAVIFFTSKMAAKSEIIAILSTGISFGRLMRIYLIGAAIISLVSFVNTLSILPQANNKRLDFENAYIYQNQQYSDLDNTHIQIEPGVFVFIRKYDARTKVLSNLNIEYINDNQLTSRIISRTATYNPIKQKWELKNYRIETYHAEKVEVEKGTQLDTALNMDMETLRTDKTAVEELNTAELDTKIRQSEILGRDDLTELIWTKWQRYTSPLSVFFLTVIGVCVSYRKKRNGVGLNLFFGILMSLLYYLTDRIAKLMIPVGLDPVLAAIIAKILFVVIAIRMYLQARKV